VPSRARTTIICPFWLLLSALYSGSSLIVKTTAVPRNITPRTTSAQPHINTPRTIRRQRGFFLAEEEGPLVERRRPESLAIF